MRIPLIAGNWKMNLTLAQATELVNGIRHLLPFPGSVEVVVASPALYVHPLAALLRNSYIGVAVQNLHHEEKGAYTGEWSAAQARDAGAEWAIVGHSERRQYFRETDALVNRKIRAALAHALVPILCVGETLDERERGDTETVIRNQILDGLQEFTSAQVSSLVIAYEPVWAIGTGKTATPDQAQQVHAFIRALLSDRFDSLTSSKVRILYGGSVKPDNSAELLSLPDVDGALVGGASLKAEEFVAIVRSASPK